MGNKELEILGEEILSQNGSFRQVRRWVRGMHPEIGVIVRGYTGWETMIDVSVIKPLLVVYVIPEVLPIPLESKEKVQEFPVLQNVA
jgi:hypothetical protein